MVRMQLEELCKPLEARVRCLIRLDFRKCSGEIRVRAHAPGFAQDAHRFALVALRGERTRSHGCSRDEIRRQAVGLNGKLTSSLQISIFLAHHGFCQREHGIATLVQIARHAAIFELVAQRLPRAFPVFCFGL